MEKEKDLLKKRYNDGIKKILKYMLNIKIYNIKYFILTK